MTASPGATQAPPAGRGSAHPRTTRREIPAHPAPFSSALLPVFAEALDLVRSRRVPLTVLDPFAGVGGIHRLPAFTSRPIRTLGVELMPAWAASDPDTMVGDATDLPIGSCIVDAVVTSPCYGNRMADHHDARDPSHRRSYAHYYGRAAFLRDADVERNAGAMAWGDDYRDLHRRAWAEAYRVTRRGGIFVLNIKDHVRQGRRVRVSAWHRRTAIEVGWVPEWTYTVPLDGYRNGENSTARAPAEYVYVFRKG